VACFLAAVIALSFTTTCRGASEPETGAVSPLRASETWNADLRRATLGAENRAALPAAPNGAHRFDLTIPHDAVLRVGFGLKGRRREHRTPAVRFRITFENGDDRRLLIDERIGRGTTGRADRWYEASASLGPLAGQTGTLVFRATRAWGRPEPRARWSRPRLVADNSTRTAQAGSGPNLVLISVDTLRADHLGCYGYRRPTSPNIDRMAAEGVRFANATATSNWTLPSHASLFTGLHPSHHGAHHYGLGTPIPEQIDTLAEYLFRRGFETAGFVGGVFVSAKLGFAQGFDRFRDPGYAKFRRVPFAANLDASLWWMAAQRERPFFLFLHTYATHMPYTPAAPYDSMFDAGYEGPYRDRFTSSDYQPYRYTDAIEPRVVEHIAALYDASIRQMDEQVGRLMEFVESANLASNTCVLFISDHGEEFKEHGNLFHHNPKLFDELVRVPLIVWCPSRFEGGQVVEDVVSLADVLPTLLELTGGEVPANLDGTSFLAALRGEPLAAGRIAVAEVDGSTVEESGAVVAMREAHYKLVASTLGGNDRLDLFDLERDPGETRNIAEEHPEIVVRMSARLRKEVPMTNERRGSTPDWGSDPATLERLRQLGYIR